MGKTMAIVKVSYTKHKARAKATIRYIQHRAGNAGVRITRSLFGSEGRMERAEAYRMIDDAKNGSTFFRFVLSPDPSSEDTHKDLALRALTTATMQALETRIGNAVDFVASIHADHTPHRHVHVLAVVSGRLQVQDLQALRQAATTACVEQRQALDLARAAVTQEKEAGWDASV